MKVLILGGEGMAGHLLFDYLASRTMHEVWCTARSSRETAHSLRLDVRDEGELSRVLAREPWDVVVNCAGILNQSAENDVRAALEVNSLLPHRLVHLAKSIGYRLIHISTDCVFSGKTGGYREDAIKDGTSVYAKTKSLGEIDQALHLTIRTSIVGPEIRQSGIGLLHWFMQRSGTIPGYTNVWWNGVTTLVLAQFIEMELTSSLCGLVHLCQPNAISKHSLLTLFRETFGREDVDIVPNDEVVLDRTIQSTRLDVSPPSLSYEDMMGELKEWIFTHRGGYGYGC